MQGEQSGDVHQILREMINRRERGVLFKAVCIRSQAAEEKF